MENPYEILGVKEDSDLKTIRNAYFNLLKKYHPDVNKDPNAEEMTKKINMAYTMILEGAYISSSNTNIEKYKDSAIKEVKKLKHIIPELIEFYIEKIISSKTKEEIEDYLERAQNYDKFYLFEKVLIETLNITSLEDLKTFSINSTKVKVKK